jgi:type VI secretion system protein ImpJ
MRQMQPVLWSKGVLLTPQHLQTQDRFLEDLVQFQISALSFCAWGFSRLEVDRVALAGGAFALSAAAGVFPDGLLFDMPRGDPSPPPHPLEGCWERDQESLDVYLAIPEYRPGGYNVSAGKDLAARYQPAIVLRRDENTGLAEKPIQVARKNFRLLVGGESLEGSVTLRVARVLRTPAGEYQLDTKFVPPLVDISASDYLLGMTRRLVEILAARSSTLAGTRRQKNQSLADFSITDVANFWLLYTVNTHFPVLRHLYETRRGHPAQLYEAMLALAGALSTFSQTVAPRALPTYAHDDLSRCFTALDVRLRELLETVVPSNCVSLPLHATQPLIYATAIEQERYLSSPQLYLAVRAEGGPAHIIQNAPRLIKLTSVDRAELLIRRALPGLTLTHVPSPPAAVPVKLDYHYFLLNKGGSEWDAIVQQRNVAAYVPSDLSDPQLELVVVLPQGK